MISLLNELLPWLLIIAGIIAVVRMSGCSCCKAGGETKQETEDGASTKTAPPKKQSQLALILGVILTPLFGIQAILGLYQQKACSFLCLLTLNCGRDVSNACYYLTEEPFLYCKRIAAYFAFFIGFALLGIAAIQKERPEKK